MSETDHGHAKLMIFFFVSCDPGKKTIFLNSEVAKKRNQDILISDVLQVYDVTKIKTDQNRIFERIFYVQNDWESLFRGFISHHGIVFRRMRK